MKKTMMLQAKVKIINKAKHYACEKCGQFKINTELKCYIWEDKRQWVCKECQELERYDNVNIPVDYIEDTTFMSGHGQNLRKKLLICSICGEGKINTELIYLDGVHKLICKDCQ